MDAQWDITLGIDHQGIAQVIEIIKVTGVVALADSSPLTPRTFDDVNPDTRILTP